LFVFIPNDDDDDDEDDEHDDDDELDLSHISEFITGLKADDWDCSGITRCCCFVFISTCINVGSNFIFIFIF